MMYTMVMNLLFLSFPSSASFFLSFFFVCFGQWFCFLFLGMAFVQRRKGHDVMGSFELLQPLAYGLKTILKNLFHQVVIISPFIEWLQWLHL
jgi:NADH:ubiquinone oxidoreductase subunit H